MPLIPMPSRIAPVGVRWACLVGAFLLPSCQLFGWGADPDVRAAREDCQGVDAGDFMSCVEGHAVERKNSDICRLMGAFADDMCLQTLYEAIADPGICAEIYLPGVRANCEAFYASRTAEP